MGLVGDCEKMALNDIRWGLQGAAGPVIAVFPDSMKRVETIAEPDVVLIGGGIMSATLGVLLHELDPTLKIQIVEALTEVAKESSNPWNNAGTGHAALCELNYTREREDGSVDISK